MWDCFSHWLHSNELLCNEYLIHMHFDMLFESSLFCVSLGALIALEGSFPSVLPHVLLQITRSGANIGTHGYIWTGFLQCAFLSCELSNEQLEYSHIMHLCGFSPECVLLWIFSLPASVVSYSHWLHWCIFPPVCLLICLLANVFGHKSQDIRLDILSRPLSSAVLH